MKQYCLIAFIFITLNSFSQASRECACCSENHKAFDFWIGEWVVNYKSGGKAGVNLIRKNQDNCVISEQWTGINGKYTGMSTNFYNPETKQWEQLWIDNQGQFLKLSGDFDDGKMVLTSEESIDKQGNQSINKITWFKNSDGTVRQLWEIVKSNGEILVAFDGIYTKKDTSDN